MRDGGGEGSALATGRACHQAACQRPVLNGGAQCPHHPSSIAEHSWPRTLWRERSLLPLVMLYLFFHPVLNAINVIKNNHCTFLFFLIGAMALLRMCKYLLDIFSGQCFFCQRFFCQR